MNLKFTLRKCNSNFENNLALIFSWMYHFLNQPTKIDDHKQKFNIYTIVKVFFFSTVINYIILKVKFNKYLGCCCTKKTSIWNSFDSQLCQEIKRQAFGILLTRNCAKRTKQFFWNSFPLMFLFGQKVFL